MDIYFFKIRDTQRVFKTKFSRKENNDQCTQLLHFLPDLSAGAVVRGCLHFFFSKEHVFKKSFF